MFLLTQRAGSGWLLALATAFALHAPAIAADPPTETARKPIVREVREIEGWKVQVDARLLNGPDAELGSKALWVLAFKLYEIKTIVPADRVARLQQVSIVLDLEDPRLKSLQYHPSAEWLKQNGHDPQLAKAVHIPHARELVSRMPINEQPMVILHELAHAYHDQVLGFDEPRIKEAWQKFKESGKYEQVLHISGKMRRHYGLTNPMEFFAEMTESYFGTNDFYPFVRGELKKELPDVFALLETIWGNDAQAGKKPVQVFILAGQSNMEGYGHVRTIDWLEQDPATRPLLRKIKNEDGSWTERDNVWIHYRRARGAVKKGNLTAGYGVSDDRIGPELIFGQVMGDHCKNQVLLIKTAWGGRSLAVDFRPPSAGPLPLDTYPPDKRDRLSKAISDKTLVVGKAYQDMVKEVRDVLADLKGEFPKYAGQGYEIAGFVWFQGWNDMIDTHFTAEYSENLVHLIKDLRRDLQVPHLPAVIGELGVDGKQPGERIAVFRKSQAAAANHPDLKDSVVFVPTADCWDEQAAALLKEGWKGNKWINKELEEKFNKMGSQPGYHYLGSAKIYALIGQALGHSMAKLCPASPLRGQP